MPTLPYSLRRRASPNTAAPWRKTLAADLGVSVRAINIKATTTEKLGFIGRGEGLAASAAVLLDAKTPR
jgi:2-C-methyl-D-erythritol 2,4-cyclodiphosphate synthase